MSYKSTLKNNTILLTIGTLINKGFQFLAVYLYSSWLSIDEYGQFDLICTYVALMIPILSLSTQEAIFRLTVNDDDKKKDYISSAFVFDMVMFLLLSIILILLWGINNKIVVYYLIYLLAEEISTYMRGFLRAIKRLDLYSYGMIYQTFFTFVFVWCFFNRLDDGLEAILLGYAIGTGFGDIYLMCKSHWIDYWEVSNVRFSSVKKLIEYSLPLVPNEISWWLMNASDRQIINYFFGSWANGLYAIAHKVPAICSLLLNMFSISWQQEIVERVDNNSIANTDVTFNIFLKFLLSLCSVILASNFVFYYFYWDNKYFSAIGYSSILILAAFETAICQFLGGIQTAYKQTKAIGVSTIIGGGFNVFAHVVLIHFCGLYAAAISTVLGNLVILTIRFFSLRHFLKLRFFSYNIPIVVIFIYFFIISFVHKNMLVNWVNFLVSVVLFVLVNREFLKQIIRR